MGILRCWVCARALPVKDYSVSSDVDEPLAAAFFVYARVESQVGKGSGKGSGKGG